MVEEKVKLQKDDLICVYTDGIVEAMNGKREIYGEKRFMECIKKNGKLPSTEFIAKLDDEIKEFTQGYPQNDDITIVVIKEERTDTAMINKMSREIEKLKKKRMKTKDIEKKLGINIKQFTTMKKEKKEMGNKKEKIRFMTFEMKKELMKTVIEHPEWNINTYEKAMQLMFGPSITESLITNELKRGNLLTGEKRKTYAMERKPKKSEEQKKQQPTDSVSTDAPPDKKEPK
jgi:hypothetical protein